MDFDDLSSNDRRNIVDPPGFDPSAGREVVGVLCCERTLCIHFCTGQVELNHPLRCPRQIKQLPHKHLLLAFRLLLMVFVYPCSYSHHTLADAGSWDAHGNTEHKGSDGCKAGGTVYVGRASTRDVPGVLPFCSTRPKFLLARSP